MAPVFDFKQHNPFATLSLVSTSAATAQFTVDDSTALCVQSHAPGVFRLRLGQPGRTDYGLLARPEPIGDLSIEPLEQEPGAYRITQGEDTLDLLPNPLRFVVRRKGQYVCGSLPDQGEVYDECYLGHVEHDRHDWSIQMFLASGHALYGLSEAPAPFAVNYKQLSSNAKNGEHVVNPLVWSLTGWGLYVNTLSCVWADTGATSSDTLQMGVAGDSCLDAFVFVGDPAEILNQYTQLVGRQATPPLWALGTWLRSGQLTPDQLVHAAKRMRESRLSADVVLAETGLHWNHGPKGTLEWNGSEQARPQLAAIKGHKYKIGAPESARVHSQSPVAKEFSARGALLKNEDGDPLMDEAGFHWVDLIHADGNNLWREKHRAVSEAGIDFVHAMGYPKLPKGSYGARHETGGRLHRLQTLAERTTLADWVRAGKGEGLVYANSEIFLGQRAALTWSTNSGQTYQDMRDQLGQLQALGAIGIAAKGINVALPLDASEQAHQQFLRNFATAVFTSAFALTGLERLDATLANEQTLKCLDTWLNFRYRFIPYIYGALEDAARTGLPVVRSMAMSHPLDRAAHGYTDQFMCGPALLVAPILDDSGRVTVYFPKGDAWFDLTTGVRYQGGERYEFSFGLDKIPAFGREGHMLPLGFSTPTTSDFNTARLLDEVWMFGMPVHNPCVMRNKIRVMQMQGSSYVKGLEGLKILNSDGLEVKRRGAEVRISRAR